MVATLAYLTINCLGFEVGRLDVSNASWCGLRLGEELRARPVVQEVVGTVNCELQVGRFVSRLAPAFLPMPYFGLLLLGFRTSGEEPHERVVKAAMALGAALHGLDLLFPLALLARLMLDLLIFVIVGSSHGN